MPAADTTLTAQWTVNSYTITFDSASGSSVAAITAEFGAAITAPANPTRAGYTFAGWSSAVPSTMPAADTTLTAQWTANSYRITFTTGEDASPVNEMTLTYQQQITEPAAPTRAGYTFTGWLPVLPEFMPAQNVAVTAQWRVNQYTLSFDSSGGSNVSGITGDYGDTVTAPEEPVRQGYNFAGWLPSLPKTIPAPAKIII